jgi:hypothetical protein
LFAAPDPILLRAGLFVREHGVHFPCGFLVGSVPLSSCPPRTDIADSRFSVLIHLLQMKSFLSVFLPDVGFSAGIRFSVFGF